MEGDHRATSKLQDDGDPQGIRTTVHESPPPSPPTRAPCAACSFLQRECLPECIFAPYFPPDHKDKFLTIHRIFGARNIAKYLATVPLERRPSEVASLFSNASVWIQHPVYTCSMPTKSQLEQLKQELESEVKELKKKLGMSANELAAPVVQQQQQHATTGAKRSKLETTENLMKRSLESTADTLSLASIKTSSKRKAMEGDHRATSKLQDDGDPQGIRTTVHVSPPPSPPTRAPCAACSFLRRECLPGCIFAPYFPPNHKDKFLTIHRIFGARNIAKYLATIPLERRPSEVASLFSNASVWIQHPVYTCSMPTKSQLEQLKQELESEVKELKKKLGMSANELAAPVVQQQQQHASDNPALISVSEKPNEASQHRSLTSRTK